MQILVSITLITLILINFVSGDAIIGNGRVIIGVNDEGHLIVPYENVFGMGENDPADTKDSTAESGNLYVGLRSGYDDDVGLYTATESI